jgi:hypothetical protein
VGRTDERRHRQRRLGSPFAEDNIRDRVEQRLSALNYKSFGLSGLRTLGRAGARQGVQQAVGSVIILDLAGGVALLLWGLHMVHSGIVRAFGSDLRRVLSSALRSRWLALLAGLAVTALLQSSTATALMTSSFVTGGSLELVPALAIMLGANIGTTLIVQALSFNVSAVAPILFLVGLIAFKQGRQTRTRDLGRVAIGLGLMLLSLHILLDTLAPAENAPAVRTLLSAITGEPLLCVLLAALLTWVAHSSVTIVLLPITVPSLRAARGGRILPPFPPGHRILSYSEAVADLHHVSWTFIVISPLLVRRRAHLEASGRNHDHRRAVRAVPERGSWRGGRCARFLRQRRSRQEGQKPCSQNQRNARQVSSRSHRLNLDAGGSRRSLAYSLSPR